MCRRLQVAQPVRLLECFLRFLAQFGLSLAWNKALECLGAAFLRALLQAPESCIWLPSAFVLSAVGLVKKVSTLSILPILRKAKQGWGARSIKLTKMMTDDDQGPAVAQNRAAQLFLYDCHMQRKEHTCFRLKTVTTFAGRGDREVRCKWSFLGRIFCAGTLFAA